ncbi:MAG: hypothetical protein ACRCV9_16335 [Burkholderiaceae bacterium]
MAARARGQIFAEVLAQANAVRERSELKAQAIDQARDAHQLHIRQAVKAIYPAEMRRNRPGQEAVLLRELTAADSELQKEIRHLKKNWTKHE